MTTRCSFSLSPFLSHLQFQTCAPFHGKHLQWQSRNSQEITKSKEKQQKIQWKLHEKEHNLEGIRNSIFLLDFYHFGSLRILLFFCLRCSSFLICPSSRRRCCCFNERSLHCLHFDFAVFKLYHDFGCSHHMMRRVWWFWALFTIFLDSIPFNFIQTEARKHMWVSAECHRNETRNWK